MNSKVVWYCFRIIQTDQGNDIKYPETEFMYKYLLSQQDGLLYQWRMILLVNKWCWENSLGKEIRSTLYHRALNYN